MAEKKSVGLTLKRLDVSTNPAEVTLTFSMAIVPLLPPAIVSTIMNI